MSLFEQQPDADRPGPFRLLVAFASMPLVSAALGSVLFPALMARRGLSSSVDDGARFLILCGLTGLLVTLFVAIPVVVAELRRGPVSPGRAAVLGALAGNVPSAIYLVFLFVFAIGHLVGGTLWDRVLPAYELLAAVLRLVTLGSTLGAASAVTFWWIGLRGTAAAA